MNASRSPPLPAPPRGPRLPTNEDKLRSLLAMARHVLDELPIGLLVLSARGTVLWANHEAKVACAVWNGEPLRADELPLNRSDFRVPAPLWQECLALLADRSPSCGAAPFRLAADPGRNLSAVIRRMPQTDPRIAPGFHLQLDYRRPRADRDRPVSPTTLEFLSRLTFREREVALRIRDGLSTREIAHELRRSPLTIKTQLAGIFQKFGVRSRARVAVLLNR